MSTIQATLTYVATLLCTDWAEMAQRRKIDMSLMSCDFRLPLALPTSCYYIEATMQWFSPDKIAQWFSTVVSAVLIQLGSRHARKHIDLKHSTRFNMTQYLWVKGCRIRAWPTNPWNIVSSWQIPCAQLPCPTGPTGPTARFKKQGTLNHWSQDANKPAREPASPP